MSDKRIDIIPNSIIEKQKSKQVQKSRKQQFFNCFTWNKSSTVLFVGCRGKIKIYGFNIHRKLSQKIYTQIDESVNDIQVMKKSISFLMSTGVGESLFVYIMQQKNQSWKMDQMLQHKGIITFTNNQNEDLLVTGTSEKTIKIWKKNEKQWICEQTIDTSFWIFSISLNSSQTNIVCTANNENILILEFNDQRKQWSINHFIKCLFDYQSALFVDQKTFITTQQTSFTVYEQVKKNNIKNKFNPKQRINYKGCHRCKGGQSQFIQQGDLLIVKNQCLVYVFRRDSKNIFTLLNQSKQNCRQDSKITHNSKFQIKWNFEQDWFNSESQDIEIDYIKKFPI